MKKKIAARKPIAVAKAKPESLATLITRVRGLIQSARCGVASMVDTYQVMTNFEICRRIVDHEQKGEERAEYGKGLIKRLSQRLTAEFGRGSSEDNLSNMRKFSLLWKPRVAEFPNHLFGNSTTQRGQQSSIVIDLKLHKLTHQGLGQMHMYVNYYDRNVKLPEGIPTIGLPLCREKKDAAVELTLPKDANIHAKEYQLHLPSKELLKAKLLEWTRAEEAQV